MTLFVDFLEKRLLNDLPGINSHIKMAPKVMERAFRSLTPTPDARDSAVMLILINKQNPELLFTLRSSTLKSHKGQISFPGGRIEKGESYLEAALRETEEEIGIMRNEIVVIGAMSSLFVPPSKHLIYPFVGLMDSLPNLCINESEVEECFTIPLEFFKDNNNRKMSKELLDGYEVDLSYWELSRKAKLWGATSMILQELLDIYEEWQCSIDNI